MKSLLDLFARLYYYLAVRLIQILDYSNSDIKPDRKKTAISLAGGDAAKNIRLATRPDRNWFLANVIKTEINGTRRVNTDTSGWVYIVKRKDQNLSSER